jgi:hypothetical protein
VKGIYYGRSMSFCNGENWKLKPQMNADEREWVEDLVLNFVLGRILTTMNSIGPLVSSPATGISADSDIRRPYAEVKKMVNLST